MAYILNIERRKIHNSCKADGRCRLNLMKESNMKSFESLEEAVNFLPKGKKTVEFCTFCMRGEKKNGN